jgi:hypothetical protein
MKQQHTLDSCLVFRILCSEAVTDKQPPLENEIVNRKGMKWS